MLTDEIGGVGGNGGVLKPPQIRFLKNGRVGGDGGVGGVFGPNQGFSSINLENFLEFLKP